MLAEGIVDRRDPERGFRSVVSVPVHSREGLFGRFLPVTEVESLPEEEHGLEPGRSGMGHCEILLRQVVVLPLQVRDTPPQVDRPR